MDNITHSVIGLVAGDALHAVSNPRTMPTVERRKLFVITSMLANNVPDVDFLMKHQLPAPLGLLLHHRGFTHTLAFAIPESLLVMIVVLLMRGTIISTRIRWKDWLLAFVTAVIGVSMHIFADSWNSYGVHPFYPFNNAWYYGDFVFIVEPLLWCICGGWILLELSFPWRLLFFSLFSLVVGYGFQLDMITINHLIVLLTVVCAMTLLMGLMTSSRRGLFAVFLIVGVMTFFRHQSQEAKAIVQNVYQENSLPPPEDISLSPSPMNPFCWTAMPATVEGTDFVIRKGNITMWQELFTPDQCRLMEQTVSTVSGLPRHDRVEWVREFRTPISLFTSYYSDCYFKDWLRFARLPQIANGIAFDVRFTGIRRRNFTEMVLKPGRACLEEVPPWELPRLSFLGASK